MRLTQAWPLLATVALSCSPTPDGGPPLGTGGFPATGGLGNSGGAGPGAGGGLLGSGGLSSAGGAGGGLSAVGGAGGSPLGVGGQTASGGSALPAGGSGSGGAAHVADHCKYGYDPDPTDATMAQGPDAQTNPVDTWIQPEAIQWMEDHQWEAAHFAWHRVRRCPGAGGTICNDGPSKGVTIPTNQECKSDGDGLEFLAMHRHMIQSLKQLWPNHTEMFEGFDKFPQAATDLPEAWRGAWTSFGAADLANAKIADEIDKPENYSRFSSEGQFGRWIQCGMPSTQFVVSGSGLHGSLHFKWTPNGNPPHSLGNQESNIDNYMFWKMHGWIDKVWEKYRRATGKPVDDPELDKVVEDQCREMDTLATYIDPDVETEQPPRDNNESGYFHETVRPIFEGPKYNCQGCHFPGAGTNGALTLGGDISSTAIVQGIVNRASVDGGQYKVVVPGNAAQSWLYRKMSGTAMSAGCVESGTATCNTGTMPPTLDVTVSAEDLEKVRHWIEDLNAELPTVN
jgi:hypothetical protein